MNKPFSGEVVVLLAKQAKSSLLLLWSFIYTNAGPNGLGLLYFCRFVCCGSQECKLKCSLRAEEDSMLNVAAVLKFPASNNFKSCWMCAIPEPHLLGPLMFQLPPASESITMRETSSILSRTFTHSFTFVNLWSFHCTAMTIPCNNPDSYFCGCLFLLSVGDDCAFYEGSTGDFLFLECKLTPCKLWYG